MQQMKHEIVRFSDPNKYDHAPHGAKCLVMKNEQVMRIFLQTSSNEEEPNWELVEDNTAPITVSSQ